MFALRTLSRAIPRVSAAIPTVAARVNTMRTASTLLSKRFFACEHEHADEEVFYSKAFVGKPAPAFKGPAVVDGAFKDISLSDYKGKYVVLFFYPLDFTFVCPTEIIEFSEMAEEFRKINTEVIACSVDSKFSHLAWIDTPRKQGGLGKMNIPVLADLNKNISRDYGVLMEEAGHTCRGTFIIDGNGKVRHISLNDPPVGRNVQEVLRLVAGYQHVDKHGEVVPCGWKKAGDATIKPSPKAKLEYFEKKH